MGRGRGEGRKEKEWEGAGWIWAGILFSLTQGSHTACSHSLPAALSHWGHNWEKDTCLTPSATHHPGVHVSVLTHHGVQQLHCSHIWCAQLWCSLIWYSCPELCLHIWCSQSWWSQIIAHNHGAHISMCSQSRCLHIIHGVHNHDAHISDVCNQCSYILVLTSGVL